MLLDFAVCLIGLEVGCCSVEGDITCSWGGRSENPNPSTNTHRNIHTEWQTSYTISTKSITFLYCLTKLCLFALHLPKWRHNQKANNRWSKCCTYLCRIGLRYWTFHLWTLSVSPSAHIYVTWCHCLCHLRTLCGFPIPE